MQLLHTWSTSQVGWLAQELTPSCTLPNSDPQISPWFFYKYYRNYNKYLGYKSDLRVHFPEYRISAQKAARYYPGGAASGNTSGWFCYVGCTIQPFDSSREPIGEQSLISTLDGCDGVGGDRARATETEPVLPSQCHGVRVRATEPEPRNRARHPRAQVPWTTG